MRKALGFGEWDAGRVERRSVKIAPARFRPCERPYRVDGEIDRKVYQSGEVEIDARYVSCGTCETCIGRRIDQVTGGAQAESLGADRALMITLTIGGDTYYRSQDDNPLAKTLQPELVRAYLKRLRTYGVFDAFAAHRAAGGDDTNFVAPRYRYMLAGELGEAKNRVHYHVIIWCYGGDLPELPRWAIGRCFYHGKMGPAVDLRMFSEHPGEHGRTYWPYGYSQVEEFNPKHPGYVAKYTVKSVEERTDRDAPFKVMMPGRSTRPLLGAAFFEDLAMRHVDAQLPIVDRNYRMPPSFDASRRKYGMTKAAMMLTFRTFEAEWLRRAKADKAFPAYPAWSPLQEQYHGLEFQRLESKAGHEIELQEAAFFREQFRRNVARKEEEQLRLDLEIAKVADGFGGDFIGSQIRNFRLQKKGVGAYQRV